MQPIGEGFGPCGIGFLELQRGGTALKVARSARCAKPSRATLPRWGRGRSPGERQDAPRLSLETVADLTRGGGTDLLGDSVAMNPDKTTLDELRIDRRSAARGELPVGSIAAAL